MHLTPKICYGFNKFLHLQGTSLKFIFLIWSNPQFSVIFLIAENPAENDTIFLNVRVRQQLGKMGLAKSIQFISRTEQLGPGSWGARQNKVSLHTTWFTCLIIIRVAVTVKVGVSVEGC